VFALVKRTIQFALLPSALLLARQTVQSCHFVLLSRFLVAFLMFLIVKRQYLYSSTYVCSVLFVRSNSCARVVRALCCEVNTSTLYSR
jgi:hypothetical protein